MLGVPVRTREFERLYPLLNPLFNGIARKLTTEHQRLWPDMVQEAWLACVRIPLCRVRKPKQFFCQVAKRRMIDFLRHEHANRFDTFHDAFRRGYKLCDIGGQLHMVHGSKSVSDGEYQWAV